MSDEVKRVLAGSPQALNDLYRELTSITDEVSGRCGDIKEEVCGQFVQNVYLAFEFLQLSQHEKYKNLIGDIRPRVATFQRVFAALKGLDTDKNGVISPAEGSAGKAEVVLMPDDVIPADVMAELAVSNSKGDHGVYTFFRGDAKIQDEHNVIFPSAAEDITTAVSSIIPPATQP